MCRRRIGWHTKGRELIMSYNKQAHHVQIMQKGPSWPTAHTQQKRSPDGCSLMRRTRVVEARMNFYLNLNIFAKMRMRRLCSRGDRNKGQNLEKWLHDYYIVFISISEQHFLHSNRDYKTSLQWRKKEANGTKKKTRFD